MSTQPVEAEVTSQLWKFIQLLNHSAYFRLLVEGAALFQGKPYSRDLAAYVASRPEVLNSINITLRSGGSSVDTALEALMVSNGAAVDSVINAAVAAYTGTANA